MGPQSLRAANRNTHCSATHSPPSLFVSRSLPATWTTLLSPAQRQYTFVRSLVALGFKAERYLSLLVISTAQQPTIRAATDQDSPHLHF
ncbi:hypothetical protein AA0116_g4745 [Alternaria tenuissima]|nr:hypothetical protein AA0116_g4745 [Alternaria tenuissima]